jgi:uncharacterized protein YodC (DUF2158 family)
MSNNGESIFVIDQEVQLKSGGPKMTVYEVYLDDDQKEAVLCRWLDDDGFTVTEKFYPATLQVYDKAKDTTLVNGLPKFAVARLVVDVVYELNGVEPVELGAMLIHHANRAHEEGLLTGSTDAEVHRFKAEVTVS